MDSQTITEFLKQVDDLNRRSSGNSKSKIFTQRARALVVSAYQMDGQTQVFTARKGVDTSKANRLIEMGFESAIYGAGRSLLQK